MITDAVLGEGRGQMGQTLGFHELCPDRDAVTTERRLWARRPLRPAGVCGGAQDRKAPFLRLLASARCMSNSCDFAQCRTVKISILGDEGVPVQVDGEAWIQPPGYIRIIHKNRAQTLTRDRVRRAAGGGPNRRVPVLACWHTVPLSQEELGFLMCCSRNLIF